MANYHIGLDFGTSQTKVCLLNKDSNVREFLKFDNNSYFLPSLIVKKQDNTFSYGNENVNGIKYRYFKMAAAEDEDLIQVTNENLEGNLENGTIDDFRKYSTNYDIKPEILVVLYLTYIYLLIKQKKRSQNTQNVGGLLGRLAGNNTTTQNTFSINLGIPTEWNNPNHIKRRIKFQSLLITSIELANQFDELDTFLNAQEEDLLNKISIINKTHLAEIYDKSESEKEDLINKLLNEYKLSVFPESAAGVNFLLKEKKLNDPNKPEETLSFATLDIGAGTSDIAIFEVQNNILRKYYCSESVEIASNDFYREYAKQHFNRNTVTFEEIKTVENIVRNVNFQRPDYYRKIINNVRGFLNSNGIEFAIRKTFYRKYYIPLYDINPIRAFEVKNYILHQKPIIVLGGGANLEGFCAGIYCYFPDPIVRANADHKYFEAKPITDFVNQVDIIDEDGDVQNYINLLILALGLTYEGNDDIRFAMPANDVPPLPIQDNDRYFYYDLQDAAYK